MSSPPYRDTTDPPSSGDSAFFYLGSGIRTTADFFNAARSTFPLNPPLQSDHVWDALSDSLWSGLDDLSAKEITIVWSGANVMKDYDPRGYELATSTLNDVSKQLGSPEYTCSRPKTVIISIDGVRQ